MPKVSVKRVEVAEKRWRDIAFPFPCIPVNRECLWKKFQVEKKLCQYIKQNKKQLSSLNLGLEN